MKTELTSTSYWSKRQKKVQAPKDRGAIKDLLDVVEPFVHHYINQRWVELGCSPGHISSLLYRRVPYQPFGVDFSPQAHLYEESMKQFAGINPTLFKCNIKDFVPDKPYDVVMSFGLVEHFIDVQHILDHHYRLCRDEGLIVVSIPHFRKLQWLYHYIFDRSDLVRHNIDMMKFDTFHQFAQRKNLDVLFLNYVGSMYFWNVDETGSRIRATIRKILSFITQATANQILSRLLPSNQKYYSPWIVFVGKRK